jgi:hypothetical protein
MYTVSFQKHPSFTGWHKFRYDSHRIDHDTNFLKDHGWQAALDISMQTSFCSYQGIEGRSDFEKVGNNTETGIEADGEP